MKYLKLYSSASYIFSGTLHTIFAAPGRTNCPDGDAAQILSLRILVLIYDWLRDAGMTSYYGSPRHVPPTNRGGKVVSCEFAGIPLSCRIIYAVIYGAFKFKRTFSAGAFKGTDSFMNMDEVAQRSDSH